MGLKMIVQLSGDAMQDIETDPKGFAKSLSEAFFIHGHKGKMQAALNANGRQVGVASYVGNHDAAVTLVSENVGEMGVREDRHMHGHGTYKQENVTWPAQIKTFK